MNFVRFRGWFGLSQPRFLLRVCAGRRDAFFSNWSVCRCALSAFVRFSDMRIVSHRSWTLGYTWGRASLRLICCGMRDALGDRKHELKRLLLRVPASAPLRYADHVEAAGVEQSTSYKIRNRSYSQMAGHEELLERDRGSEPAPGWHSCELACTGLEGQTFTALGTASILMLILPNSVKSAPHLVEYLLGSPNAPARCRIAFRVVIRQDAPKREVRILFLQELPDLCS